MASGAELVVVGHHLASSLQLLELLGAHPPGTGSPLHTWHVENKYYTVSIPCTATCTATPAEDCRHCEALVLVFDPAQQQTFERVQSWWQGAEDHRAEIQLVVAMFGSEQALLGGGARDPWLSAAEAWCNEQLIEFVEVCSAAPGVAHSQGSSEGAQGLARVAEALQSHMWPGAQMRRGQAHGSAAAAATAGPPAAAAAAAAAGADAAADTKEQPDQQQLELELLGDDDEAMDAFERLMADMQGARSRLGGMSDDKRRAAAAQLALRMASMMFGGEEGEEGEEGLSDDGSLLGEELGA